MNFIAKISLCITMLTGLVHAQDVDLSVQSDAVPPAAFIGGSTEFMYPILRGNPNADTTHYDSVWISPDAIDALSELQLNYLRFPGGTISQFYHFTGANGYGTNDFELDCRAGYLHIPGFKQKVNVDHAYPRNMIGEYISLHRQLETAQGNSISTLFVVNLMSHFFNGDFIPINDALDGLINSHGAGLGNLLNTSPAVLGDEATNAVVDIMVQIKSDPLILTINEYLLNQPGFQARVAENLAAIAHLVNEEIPIAGIELGNENYAFTMLQDDDLSEIPYDCTTPDSIVQQYGPLTLPLRAYIQAIIKYSMVAEIYDALIDNVFDIPTGVVITASQFNVDLLSLTNFQINEVQTEKYRYNMLWNKYMGRLNFYDAVIPHIYMKSQPKCDALDALEKDSLELYGAAYIDFYFTDVLPYQLNRLQQEVNAKPMWITEWNMNTANIFGNTFLQASYVLQFMNEINGLHEDYQVDIVHFHNLAAWRYNQFALLRTDENEAGYQVYRQSMFEAYQLMGQLHQDGHTMATVDMSTWLGSDFQLSPQQKYYSYYDEDGDQLSLLFINQSGVPLDIPLTGVGIQLTVDGNARGTKQIGSYQSKYMDATSLLSSNEGCIGYPSIFDDYSLGQESGTTGNFQVPAYSMGQLDMQLQTVTGLNPHFERSAFRIYPNPASGNFNIDYSPIDLPGPGWINLSTVTGKVLFSDLLVAPGLVQMKELPDGLYFVSLTGLDGRLHGVQKLVVRNK